MVWPFTSSSSKETNTSATASSSATSDKLSSAVQDTLEKVEHEASEMYQSTRASLEELKPTSTASPSSLLASLNIPLSAEPYLIATAVFGITTTAVVFYRTRLRRIPTPAYMTPNMLRGKRIMRGKVTSVGDSDNFRFYHTPGGIWAGWGWLRHVPTTKKGKPGCCRDDLVVEIAWIKLYEQLRPCIFNSSYGADDPCASSWRGCP